MSSWFSFLLLPCALIAWELWDIVQNKQNKKVFIRASYIRIVLLVIWIVLLVITTTVLQYRNNYFVYADIIMLIVWLVMIAYESFKFITNLQKELISNNVKVNDSVKFLSFIPLFNLIFNIIYWNHFIKNAK